MVSLDPVVGVPLGAVPRRWEQLLQHHRIGRRSVGDDSDPLYLGRAEGPLEEPVSRHSVLPRGDQQVNDLTELVDRTVDIAPLSSHLHIRLVHEPAITHGVPAGSGGLSQQRREPLHPPVHGDMVNLHTTLSQQLLDLAVGQAEA